MARPFFLLMVWRSLVIVSAILPVTTMALNLDAVGPGNGIVVPSDRENPCPGSELFMNADGSYETGYAWQYGGVVPPDYGAFAEGYSAMGTVCGISYKFTTIGWNYGTMDCYIWDSDGENPLNVLALVPGINPGGVGQWPNVTTHDVGVPDTAVDGEGFVGYWGNWPGSIPQWFVAADLDGPGGMPRTKIAPGIGYPTGWQNPSIVWDETVQALGMGGYVLPAPNPVEPTTWGRMKLLYR